MGEPVKNLNSEVHFLNSLVKQDLFSYNKLLDVLHKPAHPASLAMARILFGMLMFLDVADERGGSHVDLRWGEPRDCNFPLFPQIIRPTLPWMCVLYGVMCIGALGMSLGFKFKCSCLSFSLAYWYVLLLDKSTWNNHSYLYGLCSVLFFTTSANNYWSIDSLMKPKEDAKVPHWNYLILKFQFFILYFFAGLKKTDMEWLEGYSMTNLGKHWVFTPFTLFLDMEEIDYIIIHWSGFLLDLTVGFFLICTKTRPLAMVFCAMFHIMNTRLFSIGMFPYVCLATLPLFCEPDWPIKLLQNMNVYEENREESTPTGKISYGKKHHVTAALLSFYCCLQLFLPYSHFITKGYNNWTNGLYGYSWDMMVHSWDTTMVVVRVVDNDSGKEHFLDAGVWTHNDRWSKHADMCVQYASCLKHNLLSEVTDKDNSISPYISSENISIYIDVWCSLNGRFQQRMYDPNYDLLKARWSPFEDVEWLLPLLTEYSGFRTKIKDIQEHVYTWSNYSDVLFIADFPGLYLENFITMDLINVTLTVIEGEVYYESEDRSMGLKLPKGSSVPITSAVFHKIHTISDVPSCYIYTYTNRTKESLKEVQQSRNPHVSKVPLLEDGGFWMANINDMFGLISDAVLNILFDVPMVRRTRTIEEY